MAAERPSPRPFTRTEVCTEPGVIQDKAGWLSLWRSLAARGPSRVVLVIVRCPPWPRRGDRRDVARGPPAAVSRARAPGSLGHGGHVGRSPRVATLVRTIVGRADRTEVEAQLARVIEALATMLPEAAEHLVHAHEDLLAIRHFGSRTLAPDLAHEPSRSA